MLTGADVTILNETYRNSKVAAESIQTIIGKVYDEDLALDLNKQSVRFMSFEDKAANYLRQDRQVPESEKPLEKAMMWTSIQANTLLNNSTEHVAELMIQGNTRGITDMMKAVKGNPGASREVADLAEELMDFEEKNIQKLKAYLK